VSAVLVIKHGALGDLVQAFGALRAIRRHHATDRVVALTGPEFAPLLEACPWVDVVWSDARPRPWQTGAWLRLVRRLFAGGFARVYDLQNSDRTAWYRRLMKLAGGRSVQWCGTDPAADLVHVDSAFRQRHNQDNLASLLQVAGIEHAAEAADAPDLSWLDGDVTAMAPAGRFVLLIAGSSPQHPEKRWPAVAFAALATRLADDGLTPVLIGGASEAAVLDEIARRCSAAINLAGRTSLGQVVALARLADGCVAGDTGPAFLVVAAGCPLTWLLSRHGNPLRSAPRGAPLVVMQRDTIADIVVGQVRSALLLRPESATGPTGGPAGGRTGAGTGG